MQTHSNTENRSINELIESCMEPVRKLAGKYARNLYRVEFEELYSIGMLEVCKAASHLDWCTTNPPAYLCKAAQYAMIGEIERVYGHTTVSLDAPLSEDNSFSLADLLPACNPVSGPSSDDKRARAVRSAVKRLSPCRKAYLLRLHGFEGYGRHTDKEVAHAMGVAASNVRGTTTVARQMLRQDAQLCKVVGVEVSQ